MKLFNKTIQTRHFGVAHQKCPFLKKYVHIRLCVKWCYNDNLISDDDTFFNWYLHQICNKVVWFTLWCNSVFHPVFLFYSDDTLLPAVHQSALQNLDDEDDMSAVGHPCEVKILPREHPNLSIWHIWNPNFGKWIFDNPYNKIFSKLATRYVYIVNIEKSPN